jgi:hypothetical protein
MPKEHKVYKAIVEAATAGRLKEPFSKKDFERECSGFAHGTYNTFLWKHRKDNPAGASELFKLVSPGKFALLLPLKYGLDQSKKSI